MRYFQQVDADGEPIMWGTEEHRVTTTYLNIGSRCEVRDSNHQDTHFNHTYIFRPIVERQPREIYVEPDITALLAKPLSPIKRAPLAIGDETSDGCNHRWETTSDYSLIMEVDGKVIESDEQVWRYCRKCSLAVRLP